MPGCYSPESGALPGWVRSCPREAPRASRSIARRQARRAAGVVDKQRLPPHRGGQQQAGRPCVATPRESRRHAPELLWSLPVMGKERDPARIAIGKSTTSVLQAAGSSEARPRCIDRGGARRRVSRHTAARRIAFRGSAPASRRAVGGFSTWRSATAPSTAKAPARPIATMWAGSTRAPRGLSEGAAREPRRGRRHRGRRSPLAGAAGPQAPTRSRHAVDRPNDITSERSLWAYARDIDGILGALIRGTTAVVVVNLIPDLTVTPRFKERRSSRRAQARRRVQRDPGEPGARARGGNRGPLQRQPTGSAETTRVIGADGYHPSDEGYARWAES